MRISCADLLCRLPLLFAFWGVVASAERIITTIAGSTRVLRGEGGPATEAGVAVSSVAVGPFGNIFVLDPGNNVVVRITPNGILTIIAGNGIRGFFGDGGPATSASLDEPSGIEVD